MCNTSNQHKCTRCINDNSVKGISFDNKGVCNYCNNYDEIDDKLKDFDKLEELFVERINKVKGKYKYDAVVGISGGKDGIFVLHQLIKKYGLHVKAFTMDNGFLSDEARANIDKIVKEFGVEHEYIEFDPKFLKKFYKYVMKKWLVPCIACAYIGYAAQINYAAKENAGLCIHGRSHEQMLRYYNDDVFSVFVEAGLKSINEVDIPKIYSKVLEDISSKVDKTLMKEIRKILISDVQNNDYREFLPYFLYHDYDEKEIVKFLEENTSWTPPEEYNHYDCLIHNASKYIYQCVEGRPHILPEISVLVRNGMMTKEEAYKLLEDNYVTEIPEEELDLICNYVGLNKKWLLFKANFYRRFIKK